MCVAPRLYIYIAPPPPPWYRRRAESSSPLSATRQQRKSLVTNNLQQNVPYNQANPPSLLLPPSSFSFVSCFLPIRIQDLDFGSLLIRKCQNGGRSTLESNTSWTGYSFARKEKRTINRRKKTKKSFAGRIPRLNLEQVFLGMRNVRGQCWTKRTMKNKLMVGE